MSVSLYSDAKALWHPEKLAMLREGTQIVPSQVQLVISDLCNHDCSFCAYRMSGYESNQNFAENGERNPNRRIPTAKCLEIINDFSEMGVSAVQFTGGGEPTVHRGHIGIFMHALSVGLKCALVTNGQTLSNGWEDVYPRFSWLRVSLDAGSAKTHSSIRRIPLRIFSRVTRNISLLAAADVPDLGVSFIVTKENFEEIFQAAQIAKDCGATYIRFAAIFSPDGSEFYDDKESSIAENGIALASELETDAFRVIDMFSSRRHLSGERPDYKSCYYQEFNTYIGGDLNVYRCCGLAYNDRGLIGSLRGRSFRELWESQAKRDCFSSFDARGCRSCAYNDKNRLINLAVSDPPKHLEFV